MGKKIGQFLAILVILFLVVALVVGLMYIWEMLSVDVVKEALLKTGYTVGAIFVVGVVIMIITDYFTEKK